MGRYITEPERYQIEILLKEKYSISEIAETLEHKYNTLYKEIRKGTVKQRDTLLREHYVYKADYAQRVYNNSTSNRGRCLKIGADCTLAEYLEEMIGKKKYSPEMALAQARKDGLSFGSSICFKTVYNYLDAGFFTRISNKNLPYKKTDSGKKKPVKKRKTAWNNLKGKTIEARPADILDRKTYGHWEMDTVQSGQGTGKACLLVLSERMTRQEIIIKLPNKKTASVVAALNRLEKQYGKQRFRRTFLTITCDNGTEFLHSAGIEKSIFGGNRTAVYYCHPYSSYERGTNENINRMIRRFFPKKTNFDMVTKKQLQFVQDWINNYPRKIFDYQSANEMSSLFKVA